MDLSSLVSQLSSEVSGWIAQYTSATRLYAVQGQGPVSGLMLERWQGHEGLSELYCYDLLCLSTDVTLDLDSFLGTQASLVTSMPDGSTAQRSGLIQSVTQSGADGGMARYRIRLRPWLWALTQQRHSRVFQEKSVVAIVEAVFAGYSAIASWRWTDEVQGFLSAVSTRSYCVQYRESDYDFVARLLAEEGLGYCFEESADAPGGHRLVIFADSTALPQDDSSASALGGTGIRFHRADATEQQDTLQVLGAVFSLPSSSVTLLSYDYKAKQAIAASAPASAGLLPSPTPTRESYDYTGVYAFTSSAEAGHYAGLQMQAREARSQLWTGRGTVRSFRAGRWFGVSGASLPASAPTQFLLSRLQHAGSNNLSAKHAAVATIAPARAPDEDWPALDPAVLEQAGESGYGNRFEALGLTVPWRPALQDGTGLYLLPRPTAPGSQTAIVIGPNGETSPNGADELYCDALGRVKVRFHWQQGQTPDDAGSCWIRVAQTSAGGGIGSHFLPRIGQEVRVVFLDGDIDRPLIAGALYNGRGEGGVASTPAGQPSGDDTDPAAIFGQASDLSPAGQGNLAGGNGPAWHGAAADDDTHRNAAALSGLKSQEFGGTGYNQLVFDDSDSQQRVQLSTTQANTQLNLGHLIHAADNHRGSFRGQGFELRTDAYGSVRGQQGLLLSSYSNGDALTPAPVGDFTGGLALLKQALSLAQTDSQAAGTHQTVQMASAEGVDSSQKSQLSAGQAPLAAMTQSTSGQLNKANAGQAQQDAQNDSTAPGDDKVPHFADPILAIAGRAGLGMVAGQDLHVTAGEAVSLASGADSNLAVGNQLRIHSGQAIGMLAGAVKAGDNNTGLQLIAAKGPVDLQAQTDQLNLLAKNQLKLVSANAAAEFAGKTAVTLKTAQGASVVIQGGNITFNCPGTLTVHAANKSFTGATQLSREMNQWPNMKFDQKIRVLMNDGETPAKNYRYQIIRADGSKTEGVTDGDGWAPLQQGLGPENFQFVLLGPAQT